MAKSLRLDYIAFMRVGSWISRCVARPFFWVVFVGAIFAVPVIRAVSTRLPPALPVLGEIPDFSLLDQKGEPFGSANVRGRVWVGAVLSTLGVESQSLGGKIKQIQHRAHNLGVHFHVVCVTPHPESDSPADLDAFVRAFHGSPRMWSFLTGPAENVELLLGPLRAYVPGASPLTVVLVDSSMHVRAVYDLESSDVVERVLRDVGLLSNRGE